ncbi:MAG: LysE family translocator [Dokdonella sp.]|uniref:LysE family translocator n=1 Tax=Dokdonella sp. TaxID=2291710 RepID=UPI0032675DA2
MPIPHATLAFALLCLGMAMTPGPNMIYLASRSISQGPVAGLTSLAGTAIGFVIYSLCAAFGVTALLLTVPVAYDVLRFCGALYLAYLAWQALKPDGTSPFAVRTLPNDSPRRLITMGLMTNLLNPKAALLYLSLLPQFIDTAAGHVLAQSLLLCAIQIVISMSVNGTIILIAGSIAGFLSTRPTWITLQRWLMGSVLAGLAIHMAAQSRTR